MNGRTVDEYSLGDEPAALLTGGNHGECSCLPRAVEKPLDGRVIRYSEPAARQHLPSLERSDPRKSPERGSADSLVLA